ncbi:MAG: aminotransferase class I/II-fold pyridoxal phosphate-dependent enzyme [Actinomycetota bacterium]
MEGVRELTAAELAETVDGRRADEIAAAIARHLRDRAIPSGALLPTVRALAAELGVSASTVSDAWRTLRANGIIETDRRRGTTVRADRPSGADRAWHVPVAPGALGIDLSTGTPDPRLLPDLRSALTRATADHQVTSYLDRPVLPELEVELRRRWPSDPERITLLDGAQDALDRLIAATVAFGDRVLVETPTFPPILDMLELAGAEIIGLPLDDDGVRVDALDAALAASPTMAVFQPRAHNPTGTAWTAARAAALADRLASSDLLVIEDDHSGMVAGAPLHSTAALRPDHTIHVHSFSKSHGPDLRLAAVGGPASVIDTVVRRRQLGPSWTSRLLQHVLLGLLTDPEAEATVAAAEAAYRRRRADLIAALETCGVQLPTDGSGLNLWVPVDDERDALVTLAAAGIGAAPGSPFLVDPDEQDHIRLTISAVDDPVSAAEVIATAARTGAANVGR